MNWATAIDKNTGRPLETAFSRYADQDVEIFPSIFGGHNWQPMAFNRNTKLVYFPAHEISFTFAHNPDWKFQPNKNNVAVVRNPDKVHLKDSLAPKPIPQGRLVAWDPVKQEEVWRVSYESAWNGGILTTNTDLVFQGTADGRFVAYDAQNGEKLWEFDLGTGIIAAPITFEVDGEQYISIAVGWGGSRGTYNQFTEYIYPGTVYTFGLNKSASLPDYPKPASKTLANFDFDSNEELLAQGRSLYYNHCSQCHGNVARGTGGALPDLGYINEATYSIFEDIVLNGVFLPKGMPSFKEDLTKKNVLDIRNFIIATASNKNGEKTNGNTK